MVALGPPCVFVALDVPGGPGVVVFACHAQIVFYSFCVQLV